MVLRVIEEIPARDQTLDEVREAVTQAFIAEASVRLAEDAAQAVLDELEAGTSIFEVTQAEGREWVRERGFCARIRSFPRHYETAFRLASPTAEELRRLIRFASPVGSSWC